MPLRVLVVASETSDQCRVRRDYVGTASHESYAETLKSLRPDMTVETVSCIEEKPPTPETLRGFDGVFFSGSPIQMHEDTPETRAAARFMSAVFAAGAPAFGSCAGLQIAVVAAGGRTGPRTQGTEAAVARSITATDAGRTHPMLQGRPTVWMAPAMHSSVVTALPPRSILLARNPDTPVEAAEIRHAGGIFWGVQYYPEITFAEIAGSLRRNATDLVGQGLAESDAALDRHAQRLEALGRDPSRQDLAWQLGLDDTVTHPRHRLQEIMNFLDAIDAGGSLSRQRT